MDSKTFFGIGQWFHQGEGWGAALRRSLVLLSTVSILFVGISACSTKQPAQTPLKDDDAVVCVANKSLDAVEVELEARGRELLDPPSAITGTLCERVPTVLRPMTLEISPDASIRVFVPEQFHEFSVPANTDTIVLTVREGGLTRYGLSDVDWVVQ